jgi:hypothetical protein
MVFNGIDIVCSHKHPFLGLTQTWSLRLWLKHCHCSITLLKLTFVAGFGGISENKMLDEDNIYEKNKKILPFDKNMPINLSLSTK